MKKIAWISENTNFTELKNWVREQSNNTLDVIIKGGIPAFFSSTKEKSPFEVHTFSGQWEMWDKRIQYVNLTPHDIRLNDGTVYPVSGTIARIGNTFSQFNERVCQMHYGDPIGLPEPQEGVLLIVSLPLLMALHRWDLVAPATGHPDCIRENGFIKSVPGFVSLQ